MSKGSTTETRGRRQKVPPEDVYKAIQDAERPFLSSRQVTEKVGDVSKPTILDRLRTLKDEDRVLSHEVASGIPVWYLAEPKENGAFESAISRDEELRAAVDEIREDDETDAEVVRRLLKEAFDARERSVLDEIDAREALRAAVEDAREDSETDAEVVRRLLKRAIDARSADALDAIGADEELRTSVEELREDREPLDDAVRRVLRRGTSTDEEETVDEETLAESIEEYKRRYKTAAGSAASFFLISIVLTVGIRLFLPSIGAFSFPVLGTSTIQLLALIGAVALLVFTFSGLMYAFYSGAKKLVLDKGWEREDVPLLS